MKRIYVLYMAVVIFKCLPVALTNNYPDTLEHVVHIISYHNIYMYHIPPPQLVYHVSMCVSFGMLSISFHWFLAMVYVVH